MYMEIKNLQFSYPNTSLKTVDNFSFTVEKGEVISMLGRSGSGKSTFLRLIAGLEMPSGGSFTLNGKEMFCDNTFLQPEKRGIGMVFQDYALFPHMSVEDNIIFGLSKMSKKDKVKRAAEVLELCRTYRVREALSSPIKWGTATAGCSSTGNGTRT